MSEPQDRNPLQDFFPLYTQRRFAECEHLARLALQSAPDNGLAWKALGVAFEAQGKAAEALEAKERAAQLLPGDGENWSNFGNSLLGVHRVADAERCFRRAVELDRSLVQAWVGLSRVFLASGRFKQAAQCCEEVCKLEPQSARRLNEWGIALREAQMMPEAKVVYERALALDPAFVEVLSNLGNTLSDLGQPTEAEQKYRAAIALRPLVSQIHSNLGNLLKNQGRHAEALESYREAMRLDPNFAGGHSNYLLALNHVPGVTAERIKQEAQEFGRWATAHAGRIEPAPRDATKPLRVGFVSGDLRSHPVGYFLESVLAHWPGQRVELAAFPTTRQEDALSQRVKRHFAKWQPIAHLDDAQAARVVASCGVDVLVDLSGHTALNRLSLFAWKPARVQATWLGYFATTGMEQIDWLIADEVSVPRGEEGRFTEMIWRLPATRLCFTPPAEAPDVAPSPAPANGHVTFGSFQNLGKINDGVLAAWSRVLAQVPGARLRMQNSQLADGAAQHGFTQRLTKHGIDPARVDMHGKTSRNAYLRAHAQVDIILDTFPYPGGTTTCEALWMGVPTITLAGDSMLSRQGRALLEAAGLHDWVAPDEEGFVRLAAERAASVEALASLRSGLRDSVARSALFDAKRFANELASAFEAMARER